MGLVNPIFNIAAIFLLTPEYGAKGHSYQLCFLQCASGDDINTLHIYKDTLETNIKDISQKKFLDFLSIHAQQ